MTNYGKEQLFKKENIFNNNGSTYEVYYYSIYEIAILDWFSGIIVHLYKFLLKERKENETKVKRNTKNCFYFC